MTGFSLILGHSVFLVTRYLCS